MPTSARRAVQMWAMVPEQENDMYARYFETESAARAALAAWADKVRKDWTVGEVTEVSRSPELTAEIGPQTCRGAVAPFDKKGTPDVPGRFLRVEARGGSARFGEPARGLAQAEIEVCFPA